MVDEEKMNPIEAQFFRYYALGLALGGLIMVAFGAYDIYSGHPWWGGIYIAFGATVVGNTVVILRLLRKAS